MRRRILMYAAAVVLFLGVSVASCVVEAAGSAYWGPGGGGGGPLVSQLYVDFDAINQQIKKAGSESAPDLAGSLYAFGGGGFAANYNLRIGGGGGRGEVSGGDSTSLSIGYGYFDIAFTSPVNSSLTLLTGSRFGTGSAELEVASDKGSISFGLVNPYVEVEKKVTPFLALVGNVGYFHPFQVGDGDGPENLIPDLDDLRGLTLGMALRFGAF